MYRSTKGASKARRDQINAEIRNLKDLLPISEADKARLSYLHIMSLASMYTRKSVFFTQAGTAASLEECARFLSFHELSELTQALPGFLMLVTGEGKAPVLVRQRLRAPRTLHGGSCGTGRQCL
ncbi:hypothetical protein KUCAC02_004402 [Chaenocephalus aceratus]|uniref:Uncharacterized protein n=1 Tax=Chaenocephalus aceratus TaxID=36190 RepID=A0ACB9WYF6_CHAAC|nr:hypothetical protein KUCAC02_004402 [Chaenocephalus aceratus]